MTLGYEIGFGAFDPGPSLKRKRPYGRNLFRAKIRSPLTMLRRDVGIDNEDSGPGPFRYGTDDDFTPASLPFLMILQVLRTVPTRF